MLDWPGSIFDRVISIFVTYLGQLWPNFSALVDGSETTPLMISAFIISALLLFFFSALVFVVLVCFINLKRIRKFIKTLVILKPADIPEKRRELLQLFVGESRKPGKTSHFWKEFDESLVLSRDGDRVYNTLDAAHFFNTHTLARGVTESRLLAAIPSFLIAIGVLGTFIGLTVGLTGLELGTDADVAALRDGIQSMIQGAAVAFSTSVWGVLLSLLFNFSEKLAESLLRRKIAVLQDLVDYLFPRLTAESSLNEIAGSSLESKQALQTLHEKIGDQLQEKLDAAGAQFQASLVEGVQTVMREALDKMGSQANQQSTEVLETLLARFMERIGESGTQQRELLDVASQNMQTAVSELGRQVSDIVDQLGTQQAAAAAQAAQYQQENEQRHRDMQQQLTEQLENADQREKQRMERLQEQFAGFSAQQARSESAAADFIEAQKSHSERIESHLAELLSSIGTASGAMERATDQLSAGADSLSAATGNLQETARAIQGPLNELTLRVTAVAAEIQKAEERLGAHAEQADSLHSALISAANDLSESSQSARTSFKAFGEQQAAFLAETKKSFETLGSTLRKEVQMLENQAKQWLDEYGQQVYRQTTDRMGEWDQQTRSFADELKNSLELISSVVDEIESKVGTSASN